MTRSDLIIRFMSGIYGLTHGQAEAVVDWIEADRRRICAPLLGAEHGDYNYQLMKRIEETLKLAGLEAK